MRTAQRARVARSGASIKLSRAKLHMTEAAFAIRIIKATPVTPEVLAAAEKRAERARSAKKAKFLDKYRAQPVAA